MKIELSKDEIDTIHTALIFYRDYYSLIGRYLPANELNRVENLIRKLGEIL